MRDRLDKPHSVTIGAIGEGEIAPVALPDRSKAITLHHTSVSDSASAPSTRAVCGVTDFEKLIHFCVS